MTNSQKIVRVDLNNNMNKKRKRRKFRLVLNCGHSSRGRRLSSWRLSEWGRKDFSIYSSYERQMILNKYFL